MTNQIKSSLKLFLFVTVFVLTLVLFVPAVAFADSEIEPDTGSIDSSNSSGSESSLDGCTTPSTTEASLSDNAVETSTEEPSSDSTENPSIESTFENTSDDSETAVQETVDPESEGGDCYVATITPDAVVFGSGS